MLLGLLLAGAVAPCEAQRLTTRFPRPAAQAPISPRARVVADSVDRSGAKILGALIGGAVGLYGGALLGARIEQEANDNCYDDCGLAGALLGGMIGESLLLGAGIQIADPDRTRTTRRLLGPPLIMGAAVALAASTNNAWPLFFAVPIQIAIAW